MVLGSTRATMFQWDTMFCPTTTVRMKRKYQAPKMNKQTNNPLPPKKRKSSLPDPVPSPQPQGNAACLGWGLTLTLFFPQALPTPTYCPVHKCLKLEGWDPFPI